MIVKKQLALLFGQPCTLDVNLEGSRWLPCVLDAGPCQRAAPALPPAWIHSNNKFINASLITILSIYCFTLVR